MKLLWREWKRINAKYGLKPHPVSQKSMWKIQLRLWWERKRGKI